MYEKGPLAKDGTMGCHGGRCPQDLVMTPGQLHNVRKEKFVGA